MNSLCTRGFTLIELMLSVSIVAGVALFSLPVWTQLSSKNDLDTAVSAAVHALRRAQTLSQGSMNDSTWGVSIQQGSITLFKGVSFAARDTALDETTSISTSLTPSGMTEIVFAKLSGTPQQAGTLTLSGSQNDARSVTITSQGLVSY